MRNITLTKRDSHFGDLVLISPGFALLEEPNIKMMAPPINEQPDVQINSRACTLLRNLLDSLQFDNQIVAVSGFRTQAEQEKIWNDSMKENGSEFTHEFVALPGHSEHQTGLAIDLGENKPPIDYIRPSFPYDGICEEFRKKAPLFGFTERYQKGKSP